MKVLRVLLWSGLLFGFLPAWSLAADKAAGQVLVQWLGHAAFKITSVSGKVILIDPFITRNPKLSAEQKDLAKLGKVDLILITHAHGDHVGDGPALARQHNAPLYAPAGLNDTLVALGELPNELSPRFNKGGVITPLGEGIKITMTRAEHSSEYKWTNPKTGQAEVHVGGEPAGFIIELENGFKVYHMGDTGLFGDMGFIGSYYRPDLMLIPVGGHFVMSPKDAAYATRHYLKPKYAIPMRYGTNPNLKGTPEEYSAALGKSTTRVLNLKFWETVKF
ncbi:MAG TPA: metal-dependent hydrolase [Acidiferrobacterales bacterium]|nr:metal-dependent hydrolase [Acidiferrobacterales bacterium]